MKLVTNEFQAVGGRDPADHAPGETAERLGALRRMSGALAHDFNNLLAVIIGANEKLAAELDAGAEQQQLALLGLHAAEQGAELLRRLLTVGQDQPPPLEAIDCAEALRSLRRMARQAIPAGIWLAIALPAEALRCEADPTGLEAALLNLCINAGQATPDGGTVFLQAREAQLTGDDFARLGMAPGRYVAFVVRDNGAGMSSAILARATEPLFTTKPDGTGLGLSSVEDFAATAHGRLVLESREHYGTTATLYVPEAARDDCAVAA